MIRGRAWPTILRRRANHVADEKQLERPGTARRIVSRQFILANCYLGFSLCHKRFARSIIRRRLAGRPAGVTREISRVPGFPLTVAQQIVELCSRLHPLEQRGVRAFCTQGREHFVRRFHGGPKRRKRVDRGRVSHRGQLVEPDQRAAAELGHVGQQGAFTSRAKRSELLCGFECLGKNHVRAGGQVVMGSPDCRVEALHAHGVGPGGNHEVAVARADTAARIFAAMLEESINDFPVRCPHRLGIFWSSRCSPATPASSYSRTVRSTLKASPKPVSASHKTGSDVARASTAACSANSVWESSPTSGSPAQPAEMPHRKNKPLRSRAARPAWQQSR